MKIASEIAEKRLRLKKNVETAAVGYGEFLSAAMRPSNPNSIGMSRGVAPAEKVRSAISEASSRSNRLKVRFGLSSTSEGL